MLSGLYFTVSVKLRVLIASLGCRHRGLDRRIVHHCTLNNLPCELRQSKIDTNPAGNAAARILLRNFKQHKWKLPLFSVRVQLRAAAVTCATAGLPLLRLRCCAASATAAQ